MTPAELYADVRLRMSDLARGLSEEQAATPVPGCPIWSVRDVYAHCAGIVADVLSGNIDMKHLAGEEWTQAQVDARCDTPLGGIVDEWAELSATFEPTFATLPKPVWRMLLIDLVTHEQDVRGALGMPGGTDTEAYEVARKGYAVGLAKALEARGLPGVRLEAPDWSFDTGPETAVTIRAPHSYEFFRALAGRRGIKQVLAYDWSADPEPYLPVFNHFGPVPDDDVVE